MEGIQAVAQSIPDSPRALLEFITELLLSHGYLVVFLGAALDNFGLPASGDAVMFAGGFFANSSGRLELPLIMLVGFAGALVSDNSVYWIGRTGGRPLLERLRGFRLLSRLLDVKQMARVERYFAEHGGKTVLAGRFGPGLRSTTPLFAGVSRMGYGTFLPYSLLAASVWAVASGTLGYLFGQYWSQLLSATRSFGFVVVTLLALLLLFYAGRRWHRRDRQQG